MVQFSQYLFLARRQHAATIGGGESVTVRPTLPTTPPKIAESHGTIDDLDSSLAALAF